MITDDKLNFYYVLLTLDLIQTQEAFRDEFLAIADSIYADVISFSGNPNCSCRQKVSKFILDNSKTVQSLLVSWESRFPETVNLEKVEREWHNKSSSVSHVGKIFSIDKTEEAYSDLIRVIAPSGVKSGFRGLSVLESGDKWIIFVY